MRLLQVEHFRVAHALFVVRRLERDDAVEQHDRAHVLHADVRHVAVVHGVCTLVRDAHHEFFDVVRLDLVLADQIEQPSSGAWMGEPTDQRLIFVFMISYVEPSPRTSTSGFGARP